MIENAHISVVRATRKFACEHPWKSWWHFASTLALLIGIFTLLVFPLPWGLRLLLSFAGGLTLVRMFVIYHDYLHGTILKRNRSVKLIMTIFGILILNPPSSWKRSHNHHHKNNSKLSGANIGSYPIMSIETYSGAPWAEKLKYRIARHPLTILLGYVTVFLWGMCLRPFLSKARQHVDCALSVAAQLGAVAALAVWAPSVLLFALLVPMTVASALGAYLFYCQHNFPGVKLRMRADWDFAYAALHSSSYISMGPVMRWFTGNIGYHHVHHMNAHIPFYRLPEAMAAIEELQSPRVVSLTPRSVYQCLRLNLWDAGECEMVTFREGAKRLLFRLAPLTARERRLQRAGGAAEAGGGPAGGGACKSTSRA